MIKKGDFVFEYNFSSGNSYIYKIIKKISDSEYNVKIIIRYIKCQSASLEQKEGTIRKGHIIYNEYKILSKDDVLMEML